MDSVLNVLLAEQSVSIVLLSDLSVGHNNLYNLTATHSTLCISEVLPNVLLNVLLAEHLKAEHKNVLLIVDC